MKIKDIKEKISGKKLRIVPLFMAFALVLSTLIPVVPAEAKEVPVYAQELNVGESISFGADYAVENYSDIWRVAYAEKLVSANSPVYFIPIVYKNFTSGYTDYCLLVFSVSEFEMTGFNWSGKKNADSDYDMSSTPMTFQERLDYTMANVDYARSSAGKVGEYYTFIRTVNYFSLNGDTMIFQNTHPFINVSNELIFSDESSLNNYLSNVYANNMQIGTETIETNYAGNASENIENVLGVLMNPYTGGSDNTIGGVHDAEWTFLWKWTPPIDTSLVLEISADVEYTDSLIDSLLTAVRNEWKTVSVPLYPYEDGLEGAKGTVKFTYDFIKEKVAAEIGESPKKVRLKTVYFRYARENEDGVVEYGQYTTFTPTYSSYMDVQPKVGVVSYPTGQYHSGVTERYDPVTGTIPNIDSDIDISDVNEAKETEDLFGTVRSYLNSGREFIGDFPSLLGDIFKNIPPQITTMITIGLGLLIVLRLFGR